jgi:hypothetical protein
LNPKTETGAGTCCALAATGKARLKVNNAIRRITISRFSTVNGRLKNYEFARKNANETRPERRRLMDGIRGWAAAGLGRPVSQGMAGDK